MKNLLTLAVVLTLAACADPDLGTFNGTVTFSGGSPPTAASVVVSTGTATAYRVQLDMCADPFAADRADTGFQVAAGQTCTIGPSQFTVAGGARIDGNHMVATLLFTAASGGAVAVSIDATKR